MWDNCNAMSIPASAFSRADKKAALVAFITAGFPKADSTPKMLAALADAGADILEIGVPFSDPMADGPAIQRTSEIALQNGMSLAGALAAAAEFRTFRDTPLVLMGYANSFLSYPGGVAALPAAAKDAGIDGLIAVDLADDERAIWKSSFAAAGVDMISLIAPTTPEKRMCEVAADSAGFVYAISLKGVTGAAGMDLSAARDYISKVRAAAKVPVAAGFGVRTKEQAATLSEFADGVVVGSCLAEAALEAASAAALNGDCETGAAADAAAAMLSELSGALS